MQQYEQPPQMIPRSEGHYRDWINACKGGPPASSNFEYGARLTEIALLGVVALRTGRNAPLGWPQYESDQHTSSGTFHPWPFPQGVGDMNLRSGRNQEDTHDRHIAGKYLPSRVVSTVASVFGEP